ncbi:pilus assembly protein TadG-related protein [Alloalcanivorax venustensis]|nr:pilus assembly protein TadG-related protein [Alloalcanivorax venustensis]|tara:strand:+ start:297 stop:2135 length:1839 start_codon:yes stop_codon:yes gene_type:complete
MNRQRGALLFITPIIMIAVILLGVLALDGARLYSLRQEMQSQVNAAATAAADGTQTCGGATVSMGNIRARALAAARAQGFDGADDELIVEPGVIESDDNEVLSFRSEEDLMQSNGLVVRVASEEPISALLPSSLGKVTVSAQTAVKKETFATFYTESYTASIDTNNAILLGAIFEAVLGGNHLSIDAVSLSSLSNTVADLGDIVSYVASRTGLGVDEVLQSEVPAYVVVGALRTAGGLTGGAVKVVDDVLASSGVNTNVQVSEIIRVVGNTGVPEGAGVPVLEVLSSLILNLAETPPLNGIIELDVNPLLGGLGLGDLTSLSLELEIDNAPSVVVAPARIGKTDRGLGWLGQVEGADITIRLDASLQLGDPSFSALTLKLPLELRTGATKATLVEAACGAGSTNAVDYAFEVEKSALQLYTDVELIVLGAEEPQPVCFPGVAEWSCPIPPADSFQHQYTGPLTGTRYGDCCYPPPSCSGLIDIQVSSSSASGDDIPSGIVEFRDLPLHNFEAQARSVDVGTGDVLGSSVTNLMNGINVESADIACLPLGSLLNLTLNLVRPAVSGVVEPLSEYLLGPLLGSLGISLGEAEVNVIAAEQPAVQLLQYCGPEGC